jgi:hypothetical protein
LRGRGGRRLKQLTCTSVCLADFRQGVFTEALGIALASFCKFEDLFRDQFFDGIASALDVKSRTSHFESEPNDSQALGVNRSPFKYCVIGMAALSLLTGGSAIGLSAMDAWLNAAVHDVVKLT